MPDQTMLMIYTTLPDSQVAAKLAKDLVAQRLVACAQCTAPLTSIYRWEGDIVQESEVMLILKAPQQNKAAISTYLLKHHPYQIPEIAALEVQASDSYHQWVLEECPVEKNTKD